MANNGRELAAVASDNCFRRLPREVIDEIVSHVPKSSLIELVRSTRVISSAAISQLYRFVYYIDSYSSKGVNSKKKHPNYVLPPVPGWIRSVANGTKISDIHLFWRTMIVSPHLRRQVRASSFSWDMSTYNCVLSWLWQISYLLAPSLEYLQLELTEIKIVDVRSVVSFGPFQIWMPIIHRRYDSRDDFLEKTYYIFCKPALTHLSLQELSFWEERTQNTIPGQNRARTSNVTFLSLTNIVRYCSDLIEILSWPKALKSLHFENELGLELFLGSGDPLSLQNSPEKLMSGLESQKDSLEELVYCNRDDRKETDRTTIGREMRQFSKLKRLALMRDCMVVTQNESRHFQIPETPNLAEILPPAIEELMLKIERYFDWLELPPDTIITSPKPECNSDLARWFSGVALHKKENFPSLRRIVLWQSADSGHDGSREECMKQLETREGFKKAGIEFSFEERLDDFVPRFSGSGS